MDSSQEKFFKNISKKLNVLISLSLRNLLQDKDFSKRSKRGTREFVNYLAGFDLDAKDIAEITGAPLQSVRTLLTPGRRKK